VTDGATICSRLVLAVTLLAPSVHAFGQTVSDPASQAAQHIHEPVSSMPALFEAREASGTSWLPDATTVHGVHHQWGSWEVMIHGNAFAQFIYEPGERHRTGGFDNEQFSSANWGMLMGRRYLGRGRVGLRAMVSVEPWTVDRCGFLNFLATGEMCEGDQIHDRQHPHDVFMELAGDYDARLRGTLRWQIYAGLSGEPALGPAGFPHRLSATPNPIAPITHHWLDSTHVTFGLVTIGVSERRWKAEVSAFNGREPDDARADLDLAPLDSWSGRFTVLASPRLALQVSAGHLREAEADFPPQPRSDLTRGTASATYHVPLAEGMWATTAAYGVNAGPETISGAAVDFTTHAGMVETSLTRGDRETWFGRFEVVGKPAHDLHAHEFTTRVFTVAKVQGGYVRYLKPWKGILAGAGGTVAASLLPPELAPRYGGRVAPMLGVFFVVRPTRHAM
jgi:hypothetical protein